MKPSMRLNAEDGGQRQFILVQIPQPIDPKAKRSPQLCDANPGQARGDGARDLPSACAVRATRSTQRNAGKASLGLVQGFRVYTLADDPHALVHRTRLDEATQADVAALQAAIAAQPEQRPVVLAAC